MNQKGFSQVILLSITLVLILVGIGGFLLLPEKKMSPSKNEKTVRQEVSSEDVTSPIEPTPSRTQSIQLSKPKTQPAQPQSSVPQCGDKKQLFTTLPISLSDLRFIRPLGFIVA